MFLFLRLVTTFGLKLGTVWIPNLYANYHIINKIFSGYRPCQLIITDVSGTISVPIIRTVITIDHQIRSKVHTKYNSYNGQCPIQLWRNFLVVTEHTRLITVITKAVTGSYSESVHYSSHLQNSHSSLCTRYKTSSVSVYESRDSSVGVVTRYGLDDQGSRVRSPTGAENFSLHHRVQNECVTHPVSYPMGVKRPWLEADHSPPSSAEVKERMELYLHFPKTPSWRGAQLKKKTTGTTLPLLLPSIYEAISPIRQYQGTCVSEKWR
jgi:hypothetical protein